MVRYWAVREIRRLGDAGEKYMPELVKLKNNTSATVRAKKGSLQNDFSCMLYFVIQYVLDIINSRGI
jgi:hypothetical protein